VQPSGTAERAAAGRFAFGENWSSFASNLEPERVDAARESLAEMLCLDSLTGLRFLDVGCGSGIFSLAAHQMGAAQVLSFDYDPESVRTAARVRDEAVGSAEAWRIERGDVLDSEWMGTLGSWDVVYAWGVLHHTGDLWAALAQACDRVAPGGRFFVAIYNDQGLATRIWSVIKRTYFRVPAPLRPLYVVLASAPIELRVLAGHLSRGDLQGYIRLWRHRDAGARGMDRWHDLVDWVGGHPFEAATPTEVFEFCAARGFELRTLRTVGGSHGCNEFVFERSIRSAP
jgi:SAM-dependent methyltransferase